MCARFDESCLALTSNSLEISGEQGYREHSCAELNTKMRFGVVLFDVVLGNVDDRHRITVVQSLVPVRSPELSLKSSETPLRRSPRIGAAITVVCTVSGI